MASNNGQIEIPGGHDVVLRERAVKNVTSLTVKRIVCIPERKIIRAFVSDVGAPITLYEGEDYDALNGVISMENVEARVKEELGIESSSSSA